MDPITHTIAGAAAAALVASDVSGLHPLIPIAAGVFASVTPDFDFVTKHFSQAAFLKHHHGLTHGIISAAVQGALVALIFAGIFGFQFYVPLLLACLAAEATHLMLDMMLHSNGIALFSPFTEHRFSLPILLGINPTTALANCHLQNVMVCLVCQANSAVRNPVPLALVVAALAAAIDFTNVRLYALLSFSFIALWYLLSGLSRIIARHKLQNLDEYKTWRLLGPYPAGFYLLRWLGVFEKDNNYKTVIVRLGASTIESTHNWGCSGQGHLLELAKQSPMRETFETAAYVPFEEQLKETGGWKVRWADLSHALDPKFELFAVHVHLDEQGKILRSAFRERWNPKIED